jgi:hypothetical protein
MWWTSPRMKTLLTLTVAKSAISVKFVFSLFCILFTVIGGSRVCIREIQGSQLLVSAHESRGKSASMEIFDLTKKGSAKKIYSFGEISGSEFSSSSSVCVTHFCHYY